MANFVQVVYDTVCPPSAQPHPPLVGAHGYATHPGKLLTKAHHGAHFHQISNLSGKHGVHPAGTRGLIHHGGFFGYRGPHYRGRREAEAEGDAEARDERSYGHGKAHQAHPGPGKFDLDAGLGDWADDAVTMN